MRGQDKILPEHRSKKAYVYVRQSSMKQVLEHQESGRRQRELTIWVQKMGWPPSAIVVLDSDQAKSGQSSRQREDYKQLVGDVCLGEVGLVVGLYLSRPPLCQGSCRLCGLASLREVLVPRGT